MGADINIYAAVRRDGLWELAEPLERNTLWSEEVPELGPQWKPKELCSDHARVSSPPVNPPHDARRCAIQQAIGQTVISLGAVGCIGK